MTHIIKGLQVLHNKKIVHHDIKPENILIDLCPITSDKEKEKEIIKTIMEKTNPKNRYVKKYEDFSNEEVLNVLGHSKIKLSDFGLSKFKKEANKIEIAGSPLYLDPNLLKNESNLETVENEKVDIWSLGILAYELFFYQVPFQPLPPSLEKLKQLFNKGEYFIDFKKCKKISKQFLSFLNACLQEKQKIRPLTDELLEHEFIVRETQYFTYLTIDNYKDAKFPKGDYLKVEGKITMNINDNRNINATFDDIKSLEK
jgi:serine/threonine protein kinase